MIQLFGLTFPETLRDADRATAVTLLMRMAAAAQAVQEGAPGPVIAQIRQDAEDYRRVRRDGGLRLTGSVARQCDDAARALLRLTLDSPPLPQRPRGLVS